MAFIKKIMTVIVQMDPLHTPSSKYIVSLSPEKAMQVPWSGKALQGQVQGIFTARDRDPLKLVKEEL